MTHLPTVVQLEALVKIKKREAGYDEKARQVMAVIRDVAINHAEELVNGEFIRLNFYQDEEPFSEMGNDEHGAVVNRLLNWLSNEPGWFVDHFEDADPRLEIRLRLALDTDQD